MIIKKLKISLYFLALTFCLLFPYQGTCIERDSSKAVLMVGVLGGITQHANVGMNIISGCRLQIDKHKFEIIGGALFNESSTNYKNLKNLTYRSYGFCGGGNYFLTDHFYLGGLFSFDLSWMNPETASKYVTYTRFSSFFTGVTGLAQLGYNCRLSNRWHMRIQSQFGLNSYELFASKSNDPNIIIQESRIKSLQNDILYNVSIGLVYILKRR